MINDEKYYQSLEYSQIVATWDISSILIITCAYVSLFYFLIATMQGVHLVINIVVVACIGLSGVVTYFLHKKNVEKKVKDLEFIEIELTDKNGEYRFLGQNIVKNVQEVEKCSLHTFLNKKKPINDINGHVYDLTIANLPTRFRLWIPREFKQCFNPQKQLIKYKRFTFKDCRVMHCWFKEIEHDKNQMKCYLKASDNCCALNYNLV